MWACGTRKFVWNSPLLSHIIRWNWWKKELNVFLDLAIGCLGLMFLVGLKEKRKNAWRAKHGVGEGAEWADRCFQRHLVCRKPMYLWHNICVLLKSCLDFRRLSSESRGWRIGSPHDSFVSGYRDTESLVPSFECKRNTGYQYLKGWREWYFLFPVSKKKKEVMLYVSCCPVVSF